MQESVKNNPLALRRLKLNLKQSDISDKLGVTQSLYSRLEKGEVDPTRYLSKIAKILKCRPNEVFSGDILNEIEDNFLKDDKRVQQIQYHEKKKGFAHLKIDGWYSKKQVMELCKYIMESIDE